MPCFIQEVRLDDLMITSSLKIYERQNKGAHFTNCPWKREKQPVDKVPQSIKGKENVYYPLHKVQCETTPGHLYRYAEQTPSGNPCLWELSNLLYPLGWSRLCLPSTHPFTLAELHKQVQRSSWSHGPAPFLLAFWKGSRSETSLCFPECRDCCCVQESLTGLLLTPLSIHSHASNLDIVWSVIALAVLPVSFFCLSPKITYKPYKCSQRFS